MSSKSRGRRSGGGGGGGGGGSSSSGRHGHSSSNRLGHGRGHSPPPGGGFGDGFTPHRSGGGGSDALRVQGFDPSARFTPASGHPRTQRIQQNLARQYEARQAMAKNYRKIYPGDAHAQLEDALLTAQHKPKPGSFITDEPHHADELHMKHISPEEIARDREMYEITRANPAIENARATAKAALGEQRMLDNTILSAHHLASITPRLEFPDFPHHNIWKNGDDVPIQPRRLDNMRQHPRFQGYDREGPKNQSDLGTYWNSTHDLESYNEGRRGGRSGESGGDHGGKGGSFRDFFDKFKTPGGGGGDDDGKGPGKPFNFDFNKFFGGEPGDALGRTTKQDSKHGFKSDFRREREEQLAWEKQLDESVKKNNMAREEARQRRKLGPPSQEMKKLERDVAQMLGEMDRNYRDSIKRTKIQDAEAFKTSFRHGLYGGLWRWIRNSKRRNKAETLRERTYSYNHRYDTEVNPAKHPHTPEPQHAKKPSRTSESTQHLNSFKPDHPDRRLSELRKQHERVARLQDQVKELRHQHLLRQQHERESSGNVGGVSNGMVYQQQQQQQQEHNTDKHFLTHALQQQQQEQEQKQQHEEHVQVIPLDALATTTAVGTLFTRDQEQYKQHNEAPNAELADNANTATDKNDNDEREEEEESEESGNELHSTPQHEDHPRKTTSPKQQQQPQQRITNTTVVYQDPFARQQQQKQQAQVQSRGLDLEGAFYGMVSHQNIEQHKQQQHTTIPKQKSPPMSPPPATATTIAATQSASQSNAIAPPKLKKQKSTAATRKKQKLAQLERIEQRAERKLVALQQQILALEQLQDQLRDEQRGHVQQQVEQEERELLADVHQRQQQLQQEAEQENNDNDNDNDNNEQQAQGNENEDGDEGVFAVGANRQRQRAQQQHDDLLEDALEDVVFNLGEDEIDQVFDHMQQHNHQDNNQLEEQHIIVRQLDFGEEDLPQAQQHEQQQHEQQQHEQQPANNHHHFIQQQQHDPLAIPTENVRREELNANENKKQREEVQKVLAETPTPTPKKATTKNKTTSNTPKTKQEQLMNILSLQTIDRQASIDTTSHSGPRAHTTPVMGAVLKHIDEMAKQEMGDFSLDRPSSSTSRNRPGSSSPSPQSASVYNNNNNNNNTTTHGEAVLLAAAQKSKQQQQSPTQHDDYDFAVKIPYNADLSTNLVLDSTVHKRERSANMPTMVKNTFSPLNPNMVLAREYEKAKMSAALSPNRTAPEYQQDDVQGPTITMPNKNNNHANSPHHNPKQQTATTQDNILTNAKRSPYLKPQMSPHHKAVLGSNATNNLLLVDDDDDDFSLDNNQAMQQQQQQQKTKVANPVEINTVTIMFDDIDSKTDLAALEKKHQVFDSTNYCIPGIDAGMVNHIRFTHRPHAANQISATTDVIENIKDSML